MSPIFTHATKKMNHLSRLTRPMSLLSVALLSSSALIGCGDIEVSGPPNHLVNDNHDNGMIELFNNAPIVGKYVTGSSVVFSLQRTNDGESESLDELTIESSDPALLRVSEGVESCIDNRSCYDIEADLEFNIRSKRFDVLGSGDVTLTFKDGDEVVLSREVQLVDASSLTLSRSVPPALQDEVSTIAGEGEKVVVGSEFSLRLRAMSQVEGEEQEIDISSLTELPSGENFNLEQSDPVGMGTRFHITPESEGALSIPVNVGDQSIEMNFNVVSSSEIVGINVAHETWINEMPEEENNLPKGRALAVAKDEEGAPIFGADIIWERLDGEEDDAMVVDSFTGSELNFIYEEGAQVAFKVTVGEVSEIVYLPVNIEQLNDIFGDNAFADGCDAKGDVSGSALLTLLLMGMIVMRRRAIA